MRVRLLNLLLVAALLFSATRLGSLLREPAPALPPVGTEPAPAPDQAVDGAVAPEEAPPGAYDVIVARDLFSPTRGVVQPAPAAPGQPPPPPKPPPKLVLYGVVILDGEKTAYLQDGPQDSRPKKVREKEPIAGGVVTAIRPDGVTFLYGGTEISIPLRSPKDIPAAAPERPPAAAARTRPAAGAQRAPMQPRAVPGQMPVSGAPGQAPGAEQPDAGMPGLPAPEEPTDEYLEPADVLPEAPLEGGEDAGMPMEEVME